MTALEKLGLSVVLMELSLVLIAHINNLPIDYTWIIIWGVIGFIMFILPSEKGTSE